MATKAGRELESRDWLALMVLTQLYNDAREEREHQEQIGCARKMQVVGAAERARETQHEQVNCFHQRGKIQAENLV